MTFSPMFLYITLSLENFEMLAKNGELLPSNKIIHVKGIVDPYGS